MKSAFLLERKRAGNEAGPVRKNKLFIYKLYLECENRTLACIRLDEMHPSNLFGSFAS
jgi:hypothetical protein